VKLALAPLAQREFRLMFLGRVSSFAGSTFAFVALPFAVLELTKSPTDVGLVVVVEAFRRFSSCWSEGSGPTACPGTQ